MTEGEVERRKARVLARVARLKSAEIEDRRPDLATFRVGGRIFGYFTLNHNGDGRIAILLTSDLVEQSRLVKADAERFFVPPYVGPRGWIGLRIDTPRVDWDLVTRLLVEAHARVASRTKGRARART